VSRDWTDWSLLEMLEAAGVEPKGTGRWPEEYVPRLCGWVNRLNEVRAHLKCRKCGTTLIPAQPIIRKPTPAYHITLFRCPNGEGHDVVYLNHCWACDNHIIDSRDDVVAVLEPLRVSDPVLTEINVTVHGLPGVRSYAKIDGAITLRDDEIRPEDAPRGWHLCLHCGSGPQREHARVFRQGDFCPKCGTPTMYRISRKKNDTRRICRNPDCRHVIYPSPSKLTGSLSTIVFAPDGYLSGLDYEDNGDLPFYTNQ
jgi:hypothetical protein